MACQCETRSMNISPRKSLIAQLVDAACCVVGADTGVTRIIVVANRRLPYDEPSRCVGTLRRVTRTS